MLVVSRRKEEALVLGDSIRVVVVDIRSDQVRLGIAAPTSVRVLREELVDQVRQSNLQALGLDPAALKPVLQAVGEKTPPPLEPLPHPAPAPLAGLSWRVEGQDLVLEVSEALPPGTYRVQGP